MKTVFAMFAVFLATNAHAFSIESTTDVAPLADIQESTDTTFTYESVIRYFNANAGRVPTLQELAPSRICSAFKPGSQVADGEVGVGIFLQSNLKVYFGGYFAGWIRESASWNAQKVQQARSQASTEDFSNLKNARTPQEFVVQAYDTTGTKLKTEVKIRKSPSGRYYYIVEGIQANSNLRMVMHAGVCEPNSIFADSKFPL